MTWAAHERALLEKLDRTPARLPSASEKASNSPILGRGGAQTPARLRTCQTPRPASHLLSAVKTAASINQSHERKTK